MRPTPVLEATTTKRIRSAPRSTATKRKVQMDDPMVLHGDIIRQQLTNTEGIRRVRKKAPCTIPEILRLQRKAMGNGLLKEPIFTGMSVEIISLHNEPYDLRGIMIIENVDRRASVGVVGNNNECSISAVEESYVPQALPNVEENKTEESYVPQASQKDFVEQPAEDHAYPQDQQLIHQQEETKDDSEVADLEVLKEGNNRAGDDEVNLVPSEEISQMPSEDKLDGVENSQLGAVNDEVGQRSSMLDHIELEFAAATAGFEKKSRLMIPPKEKMMNKVTQSNSKLLAKKKKIVNNEESKKKERHIVTWTPKEDDILRKQISLHGTEKWYTYLNSDFKRGGWSPEEDTLLCEV